MSEQAQDGTDHGQGAQAEPSRLPPLSDRERDFWRRAVAQQRAGLAAGAPQDERGAELH